jgi:Cu/Ag efflux pump CusA
MEDFLTSHHSSLYMVIRPMTVSVIGGVLVSTFLTLYVVPCAYSLVARFEGKRHKRELKEALEIMAQT